MEALQVSISQSYLDGFVKQQFETALEGVTWDINDFRRRCCFNKSAEWVRRNVILPFANEIDYDKGGWCINPHGGRGKKQMIFAKSASEWMEANKLRIDWKAKGGY